MKNKDFKTKLEMNNTELIVAEPGALYSPENYPLQDETYRIIGICMEVHRTLGTGFFEVVYQDAIEEEFKMNDIPYEREKQYKIEYKGKILKHDYIADFVVYGNIILETKAQEGFHETAAAQVINYLAASKLRVGLLVNFGEKSLKHKRFIFSPK